MLGGDGESKSPISTERISRILQECGELVRRHRRAVEESLREAAAQLTQPLRLSRKLNALGDDLELQTAGQRHHGGQRSLDEVEQPGLVGQPGERVAPRLQLQLPGGAAQGLGPAATAFSSPGSAGCPPEAQGAGVGR